MDLTLHNIKKPDHLKTRKRLGRGDSSGHGSYSGRGMKGQRARSGGKAGLKKKAIKARLLRIPKEKGFKSVKPKPAIVKLADLEKNFEDGQVVNVKTLIKKNIIDDKVKGGVKILSNGDIAKKLVIEDCQVSAAAKNKILAVGGEIK